MVELTAGTQVDGDLAPVLSLALAKVGQPGNLLAAAASVRFQSQTQGAPTTYTYDANGNTAAELAPSGTTTYTWDAENRLVRFEADGQVETYTYDATTSVPGKYTGLRRSKTVDDETTHFLWDGWNLLAELDEGFATSAQYTDWPGTWGGLSSRRASGSSWFYGYDLSANTRQVLDAAAGVLGSYGYTAFGPPLGEVGLTQAVRFGGQVGYYTEEAERIYVRARWYGAAVGRWVSRDPLPMPVTAGRAQRLRGLLYVYVMNAAVGSLDPSGLQKLPYEDPDHPGQYVVGDPPINPAPTDPPRPFDESWMAGPWGDWAACTGRCLETWATKVPPGEGTGGVGIAVAPIIPKPGNPGGPNTSVWSWLAGKFPPWLTRPKWISGDIKVRCPGGLVSPNWIRAVGRWLASVMPDITILEGAGRGYLVYSCMDDCASDYEAW